MTFVSTSSGLWVDTVTSVLSLIVLIVSFAVAVWAFVHIIMQRSDAFTAVGTLTKPMWLLLIGGTALLSWVFSIFGTLLALVSLTAALIYLLDVRPAIREITGGR